MKKIIALLTCLALAGLCFTGCTNNDEAFTQKSYTAGEEEIGEICIDVRNRQIEFICAADIKNESYLR